MCIGDKATGARASRSFCVRWFFVLPSVFKSLVVRVLCSAANPELAVKTASSMGGIMVVCGVAVYLVVSALWEGCGDGLVGKLHDRR